MTPFLRTELTAEGRRRVDVVDARATQLVSEFVRHPTFSRLEEVVVMDERRGRQQVLDVLAQRRFLSLAFAPMYDLAIDALERQSDKSVLRTILREEYDSGGSSTHREDLWADLCALGADEAILRQTGPTDVTQQVVSGLLTQLLLRAGEESPLYRIRVLTTIWCAGELLVGAEYKRLWPLLQRLGLEETPAAARIRGTRPSLFYFPHMNHDAPHLSLGEQSRCLERRGHADQVGDCLRDAVVVGPEAAVDCALAALQSSYEFKRSFYEQFL